MLVVGSPNSSNSNRLRELAERCGTQSYLIDKASDIDESWLSGKKAIGVTAGASAPEVLVKDVVDYIGKKTDSVPSELSGREENIRFSLPKELRLSRFSLRACGPVSHFSFAIVLLSEFNYRLSAHPCDGRVARL